MRHNRVSAQWRLRLVRRRTDEGAPSCSCARRAATQRARGPGGGQGGAYEGREAQPLLRETAGSVNRAPCRSVTR
eukprot:scaffold3234_cov105-Isochrysis_galbana.AAC.5